MDNEYIEDKVKIYSDSFEIGEKIAKIIINKIINKKDQNFLLGCPTGRSPKTTYNAIAERAADKQIDLS